MKTILDSLRVLIAAILMQTSAMGCLAAEEVRSSQPIEIGTVKWNRDFEQTLQRSAKTNKPVFALFQEVPGCDGCQTFGRVVLSHPLIVEAIETEFEPVVIYNNKGGKDAELLDRYNEPAWNFQVIRFFDHTGKDIIPRQDKVWTIEGVVARINEALSRKNVAPPQYLAGLSINFNSQDIGQALFTQHCFWTGENSLGAIEGVVKTEAGFYDGREATRVWYDKSKLSSANLVSAAKQAGVADAAYLKQDEMSPENPNSSFDGFFDPDSYRKAPGADQKRQLLGTKYHNLELNEFQATKVNSFARKDQSKANSFLSPRQIGQLQ